MGSEDKMRYFWWIVSLIIMNEKDVVYEVGGPGVMSQKIEKHTLNFKAKAWWKLVRHRLCPTIEDNVLSPVHAILIASLMAEYEFDVREFLAREI